MHTSVLRTPRDVGSSLSWFDRRLSSLSAVRPSSNEGFWSANDTRPLDERSAVVRADSENSSRGSVVRWFCRHSRTRREGAQLLTSGGSDCSSFMLMSTFVSSTISHAFSSAPRWSNGESAATGTAARSMHAKFRLPELRAARSRDSSPCFPGGPPPATRISTSSRSRCRAGRRCGGRCSCCCSCCRSRCMAGWLLARCLVAGRQAIGH